MLGKGKVTLNQMHIVRKKKKKKKGKDKLFQRNSIWGQILSWGKDALLYRRQHGEAELRQTRFWSVILKNWMF